MAQPGSFLDKSNKKIVIIEDDPIVSQLYKTRLERDGYNVSTAADGQEGFYLVYETKPDAVILDLMLPKMNGVEILKKFRAQKQYEKLPIIILTNEFAKELTREAMGYGPTEIFEKNKTTPTDMVKALARVFFAASDFKERVEQPTPVAPPPAPTPTPAPVKLPEPVSAPVEEPDFQETFFSSIAGTVTQLRELSVRLIRSKDPKSQEEALNELLHASHLISGNAVAAEQKQIAHVTAALEAYMHELCSKPEKINSSAVRTICQATDFICTLLAEAKTNPTVEDPGLVLIVDDERLSRRAVKVAMDRANLKSVALSDPNIALQVTLENTFDLLITDVQMPHMDGFTLCKHLRDLPEYKTTPVIFVTSLTDFETRMKSTASGGNEFIAKPFLFMELALKALISMGRKKLTAKAK